jgi:hypothetical protein
MLKPVSIRNSLLACLADCPADNQACQAAQFLYETLHTMPPKKQEPVMLEFDTKVYILTTRDNFLKVLGGFN